MTGWKECKSCGDDYPAERAALGYTTCKPCGEQHAREQRKHWTIAPLHKSNYVFVSDKTLLTGINNKQQR